MNDRGDGAGGFSLVEVVIAMVILGIVAMALIPVLWQGITFSSQQSTVATATRQLNALIEQARDGQSCAALSDVAAPKTFADGSGRSFEISGARGDCIPCPSATGAPISLTLTAVQGSRQLAEVTALVFVAGAKAATSCA